jgi:hypothetical protein
MGLGGWAAQILPLPIIILTLILRLATCGFHPRRGVEFHWATALVTVLRRPAPAHDSLQSPGTHGARGGPSRPNRR